MASSSEAAGPTAAPEEYGNAESRLATYMGWILLALAAALYFATLDTGLSPSELEAGDLITHQYAQVKARPSNAPGYPLYNNGRLALVSRRAHRSGAFWQPAAQPDADPPHSPASEPFCRLAAWELAPGLDDQRVLRGLILVLALRHHNGAIL